MKPELEFFVGKGGVGKSTTSAITAVYHARSRRDTLLVSLDPAHNQRDIFQQVFSEEPRDVDKHLAVKEVDTDYWIEKYLKETEKTIKQTYSYESAFNLQHYFNVLQFSPGLEEYALLLAFENVIRTFDDKDLIIFDMAPTALTLRFFSLPFITLIWLEALLKLREKIYAKKEIIAEIKIGRKEIQQDKVKAKLQALIQKYQHLPDRFTSDATRINLRVLLKETVLPLRLLGISMPLTILAGTAIAALIFSEFSIWEAALLAVILAPTDAGLGQVVEVNRPGNLPPPPLARPWLLPIFPHPALARLRNSSLCHPLPFPARPQNPPSLLLPPAQLQWERPVMA